MQRADRRTAVVTGAARGIGRAIAERLERDGFDVIATDIDAAALAVSQAEWDVAGRAITGRLLDVCDRPGVAALFASLKRVDVVVNNAGIGAPMIPFLQLERGAVERMIAVNLQGPFIMAQEALRRVQLGARIINIASRGYLGGIGAGHYVASKAGIVGLTRAMAAELRWRGVLVNAVAPGLIATSIIDDFSPQMRAKLEAREPSGGANPPEQIAAVVAFLAGPDAALINGQVLMADGGKSIGTPPL